MRGFPQSSGCLANWWENFLWLPSRMATTRKATTVLLTIAFLSERHPSRYKGSQWNMLSFCTLGNPGPSVASFLVKMVKQLVFQFSARLKTQICSTPGYHQFINITLIILLTIIIKVSQQSLGCFLVHFRFSNFFEPAPVVIHHSTIVSSSSSS